MAPFVSLELFMSNWLRIIWMLMITVIGALQGKEFELSLNDAERYAISEIIGTMGEKNLAQLLWDSSRLTALGDSIQHVPPLQLLGLVLTSPYLKVCLKKVSKSIFKWSAFIDGFGTNMDKELAEGRLFQDLPGFAKLVGGSLEQLEGYAYQHAWDEFVKCLL